MQITSDQQHSSHETSSGSVSQSSEPEPEPELEPEAYLSSRSIICSHAATMILSDITTIIMYVSRSKIISIKNYYVYFPSSV